MLSQSSVSCEHFSNLFYMSLIQFYWILCLLCKWFLIRVFTTHAPDVVSITFNVSASLGRHVGTCFDIVFRMVFEKSRHWPGPITSISSKGTEESHMEQGPVLMEVAVNNQCFFKPNIGQQCEGEHYCGVDTNGCSSGWLCKRCSVRVFKTVM